MRRFLKLKNEDWLKEQYDQGYSCLEIATLVGCSRDAVRLALLRSDVSLRTSQESNKLKWTNGRRRQSKYPLLNDKKWLCEKYLDQKLNPNEICKLVGAKNANSVTEALTKFNISIRDRDELRSRKGFSVLCNDVIEGGLLGDGFLRRWNRNSERSYATFCKRNKFLDHIELVAKSLFKNFTEYIKPEIKEYNGKEFVYYLFMSRAYKSLVEYDKRWYPKENNFKKQVPRDLVLTPKMMLHWFLDDGSTSWRKDRKTLPVNLVFCSESFTLDDQMFLCEQLHKFKLDAKITTTNSGTGYRVKIAARSVPLFFEIIGLPPVKNLAYKWKLPGGHHLAN